MIAQVFPNAVLVYDRFHVMKLVNSEMNKLRQMVGMTLRGSSVSVTQKPSEFDRRAASQIGANTQPFRLLENRL